MNIFFWEKKEEDNNLSNIETSKYASDLFEKSTKLVIGAASLSSAIASGVVYLIIYLFYDSKEFARLPDLKISLGFFALFALLVTLIIALLYFFLLKNMSNAIASNHIDFDKAKVDLNTHIENAKTVPKSLTDELSKQIISAQELTRVLKQLSSPHLIHWDLSAELELNAETVYAISADFNWLKHIEKKTNKVRFFSVIYDAIIHPDDKYMFLGTDMTAKQNIVFFERLLDDCQKKCNDIYSYVDNRLIQENLYISNYTDSIQSLSKRIVFRDLLEIPYYSNKLFKLPIPSDIVLYENTRYKNQSEDTKSSYLVISIIPVKDSDKNDNILEQYDAIFTNSEQIGNIKEWFIEVGREINER